MDHFDDFWRDYPRKVSKKDARKAWDRAVRVELPAVIIAGLKRQLQYLESRPVEFRPHAATWLNGERWEDEVPVLSEQQPRQTAFQQRHQSAIDAFDRKLGVSPDDQFTGSTIDLGNGDWRPH